MSRVWGLRLAFIGAALAIAILALRDTLTDGYGKNRVGDYIGYSASETWFYDFLYGGWGLVAAALLCLCGLYQYLKGRIDT